MTSCDHTVLLLLSFLRRPLKYICFFVQAGGFILIASDPWVTSRTGATVYICSVIVLRSWLIIFQEQNGL